MVMKYPGSKNRIAGWIIRQFPEHYEDMTYLEPYFGSGVVFFRKKPSAVETINDINGEVINLFEQMRENPEKLTWLICMTPKSRGEYYKCFEKSDDGLEQARRTLAKSWFSRGFGGLLYKSSISFDKQYNGHRRCLCDFLPERIRYAAERLLHSGTGPVQIECKDAIDLITEYNRETTLMYLDPPYMRETRNKSKLYKYEYYNDDHIRLINAIAGSKAKILISGYDNGLYNTKLEGWHKDMAITYDEMGRARREVAWRNYRVNRGYLFDELPEENAVRY
jgi:DNA adenine methylase